MSEAPVRTHDIASDRRDRDRSLSSPSRQLIASLHDGSDHAAAAACRAVARLLEDGRVDEADLRCRQYQASGARDGYWVHVLLAWIAGDIGAQSFVESELRRAATLAPELATRYPGILSRPATRPTTEECVRGSQTGDRATATAKYLLIKAWGAGFWSDLHHVLGQLIVCELTGRKPVVYWGDNSLYAHPGQDNAFLSFFQPTSEVTIDDLARSEYTFYPRRWTADALRTEAIDKRHHPVGVIFFLNRPEDVVVSDVYRYHSRLVPWVPEGHALYGLSDLELLRFVFHKYLRLQPEVAAEIDEFHARHMAGKHLLGVHLRYSDDKLIECGDLGDVNSHCFQEAQRYVARHPDAHVFLMTDYAPGLALYRDAFGPRLIHTECTRTDDVGVYCLAKKGADRKRLGVEILKDVYLAARCHSFIGNGRANPSCALQYLKSWPDGTFHLVGHNFLTEFV